MRTKSMKFRYVVFSEEVEGETWWLAQALEKDVCSQAHSPEEAVDELGRLLRARVAVGEHLGVAPFDIPAAPERFKALWDGESSLSVPVGGEGLRTDLEQACQAPEERCPEGPGGTG